MKTLHFLIRSTKSAVVIAMAIAITCLNVQARGQGARPSLGKVGGGGVRPNMSRPNNMARPNVSRPNMSRPSFGNSMNRPPVSRPSGNSMGNASIGGSRPSLGGVGTNRPNVNRPSTLPSQPGLSSRPSLPNRPSVSVPSTGFPATRPSTGIGQTLPSLPGNLAKPSLPNIPGNQNSRPSTLPGNTGGINRPSLGGVNRPTTLPGQQRPNIGANRPSTLPGEIQRPNLGGNRPSTLPGEIQRPNLGGNRPSTLPGDIQRPNIGGNRPSTLPGDIQRPNIGGNRPATLPGEIQRPNIGGNRPSTLPGDIQRPNIGGNRPSTLPGEIQRPNLGGNRPSTLPGEIQRPIIGGNRPSTLPGVVQRPGIGGNRPIQFPNGRPNDGNWNIGNNINIGNDINIGIGNRFPNRPNWDIDPGFSRPSWGLGNNGWSDNWHNNCVNIHHHHWYNGCWSGYWGSDWYAPIAWGGIGWGLSSMVNSWGYPTAYYNPYFTNVAGSANMPYDYSQPVVVNNYVTSEQATNETTVASSNPQPEKSYNAFDDGLAKFKAGDYVQSLSDFNQSIKDFPNDPVIHEVRCLALFATADYRSAAAGLNSLLSSAPGMDWTTLSSLYGNIDDYTAQLRKLEQFCKSNPADSAPYFVLAYHYLVTGEKDAAVTALKIVVANQPKDVVARRMLDSLSPPQTQAASTQNQKTITEDSAKDDTSPPPQTDLVGTWIADVGTSKIQLTIQEDSSFKWSANSKGQSPVELSGNLTMTDFGISLETIDKGSIGGEVRSNGADQWKLLLAGAPASDSGLTFNRAK